MMAVMTRRKPRIINTSLLIQAISKLDLPLYDKKHNLYLHIEGRARSNQTRVDHIVEFGHNLKVRDIETINDLNNYSFFKKDSSYKHTVNYYFKRQGRDKGMIKIAARVSEINPTKAWIKTIYITYRIK